MNKRKLGFILFIGGIIGVLTLISCSSDDGGEQLSDASSSDDNGGDNSSSSVDNRFTDSRDGKTYRKVTIGGQTWMAENLNYDPGTGTSACYDNDPGNCATFGRLYDWATAMEACPDGWHLPSDAERATTTRIMAVSTILATTATGGVPRRTVVAITTTLTTGA